MGNPPAEEAPHPAPLPHPGDIWGGWLRRHYGVHTAMGRTGSSSSLETAGRPAAAETGTAAAVAGRDPAAPPTAPGHRDA